MGLTVSFTLMMLEQVLELPFTSVAVKTSVLTPMLAQVNAPPFKVNVAMPQASEEPLLTAIGVVLPPPFAFNWTVILRQVATGAT